MTKTEIYQAFDGKISKTCIKQKDGIYMIIGKFCEIEPLDDGLWDLWVRHSEPQKALATVRINQFPVKFARINAPKTILDGEAYTYAPLDELKPAVLDELKWLGIRKARKVTDEQKAAFLKNISR